MDPILEFPADLTREEYIEFSTGTSGQGHKLYPALMLMCVGIGVFMGVEDGWTVESIAIIAVSAALMLLSAWGLPWYRRRKMGRQYDLSLKTGYDFYGTVRFYGDRVEKVCCGDVSAVRYADAVFFENEKMMVFAVRGGRSLVLPARCMTETDAEAVRAVVRERIPSQRQMLRRRMTARAVERLAPPPAVDLPEEQELLFLTVRHTPKTFGKQAARQAHLRFTASLPLMLVLDALFALLVGVTYGFVVGLALFIAVLLVPWLMQVVLTGRRAKRAAEMQDEPFLCVYVRVTDRGLHVRANAAQGDGFVSWKAVARAVEGREHVDFIGFDKQVVLSFPVETLGDGLPALRDVVTEQLRLAKGENDG